MISSSSQLKSSKMNASLADSLGISANESLKTKIPLRQIVQFAERLQAQNLEVSCHLNFTGESRASETQTGEDGFIKSM